MFLSCFEIDGNRGSVVPGLPLKFPVICPGLPDWVLDRGYSPRGGEVPEPVSLTKFYLQEGRPPEVENGRIMSAVLVNMETGELRLSGESGEAIGTDTDRVLVLYRFSFLSEYLACTGGVLESDPRCYSVMGRDRSKDVETVGSWDWSPLRQQSFGVRLGDRHRWFVHRLVSLRVTQSLEMQKRAAFPLSFTGRSHRLTFSGGGRFEFEGFDTSDTSG